MWDDSPVNHLQPVDELLKHDSVARSSLDRRLPDVPAVDHKIRLILVQPEHLKRLRMRDALQQLRVVHCLPVLPGNLAEALVARAVPVVQETGEAFPTVALHRLVLEEDLLDRLAQHRVDKIEQAGSVDQEPV